MCVIAYKPFNHDMPDYETLKTMFNHNPDGAGFMYSKDNKVHIHKGYMTFKAFYKALKKYKAEWFSQPFVLHFRISTQAGVNKECCHPFPLCDNMQTLKKLKYNSDIGVAHNGIIYLTSSYSKNATHSDTMEFITDYLSLIIQDKLYYKNPTTLKLIKKLADSKLAILDRRGHCELIGHFIEDNGIYYSNDSYRKRAYAPISTKSSTTSTNKCYGSYDEYYGYDIYDYMDYDDYTETYEDYIKRECWECYDSKYDVYRFDDFTCPNTCYGVTEFCEKCVNYKKCYM